MKQLEVKILGQSYLLACPEGGEAQMKGAVDKVDAAMSRIRDAGKVKARDRIAVLAALNLAFEAVPEQPVHIAASELAKATAPAAAALDPAAANAADPRVAALMKRIDQALARDDRLL
jgi:cell division protein ZapA